MIPRTKKQKLLVQVLDSPSKVWDVVQILAAAKASLKRRPKRTLSRGFGTGGRTSLRWRISFWICPWPFPEYGWFPSRFVALLVSLLRWLFWFSTWFQTAWWISWIGSQMLNEIVGQTSRLPVSTFARLFPSFEESCCYWMLFAMARWRLVISRAYPERSCWSDRVIWGYFVIPCYHIHIVGVSMNEGTPQIIHFNRIF